MERRFLIVDSKSGISPDALKAKVPGYEVDVAIDNFPEGPEGELSSQNEIRKMVSSGKYQNYAIVARPGSFLRKAFPNNTIVLEGTAEEKLGKHLDWIFSNYGRDHNSQKKRFFISDNHFCHGNIIRYCNRPWNSGRDGNGELIVTPEDIHRMNEDMIARWNSVVGPEDIVWNLGDFCFGKKENVLEILPRLNGKINLVMGNHDRHNIRFYYEAGFNRVYDRPVIIDGFIILSHAPVQWVKDGGVWANLYGHVHNQEMYRPYTSNTYNCCVEVNDYRPVPFEEIKARMESCGGSSD